MTEVGNQQVGAPSGSVPTQDAPFSQTQAFEPVVPANPNPVVGKIRLKQGEKEWLIRQDDRNDMMIGRNQLACQIVIKDPRVSSKHCRIFRDKTGFSLEEMSQNGTFVNGQRMAKEEVQPLQNGLQFGGDVPKWHVRERPAHGEGGGAAAAKRASVWRRCPKMARS